MGGIILAGTSSNSGKTTITIGLLRALYNRNVNVIGAKVGPDYIDPAFHAKACHKDCVNLDMWAMDNACINSQISYIQSRGDVAIIEGVMGLFDGAADGTASTAHVARKTRYPIILVVDVFGQSTSIAATVKGFAELEDDITISGVILNRTGSPTHTKILTDALTKYVPHIPYLGALPRQDEVVLESRHLGLVQADEISDLDSLLEASAKWIETHIDVDTLLKLTKNTVCETPTKPTPIAPLGKHIAIAKDPAFNFIYPHIIHGRENAGVEISYFSPLKNEAPNPHADSVYLAGGYPELYAQTLSSNGVFKDAMHIFAGQDKPIFGECGGFMVLGEALINASGVSHPMLNLLPVITSFEKKKIHLSYRKITTLTHSPFGKKGTVLKGHEFHYASIVSQHRTPDTQDFFNIEDALGGKQEIAGLKKGSVYGSYMHLIDTL